MILSNRDIKNYFENKIQVFCNETSMQEAVLKSKKAYYEAESAKSLSKTEFLYQQSKYIKKRWWLIQGLLLTVLWLFLNYLESSYYIQRSIGIAAPLFVLLIIPEIWKNKNADAMEVECTTLYSIRQIYAARMILFALVDLVLLSVFFAASSYTAKITIWELAIQFFVPFNVACSICFGTLYSKKVKSPILTLLSCFIWIAVWEQIVLNEIIYKLLSVPFWIAMLVLSFLYLGYSIGKGQKQCMETWEVKTLWN
ncbi:MAG: hypothetical protein K2M46_03200 [Lachnospiraceae bacterium]|nr:hypothetical protein [Lachnospiraceae bacterium]